MKQSSCVFGLVILLISCGGNDQQNQEFLRPVKYETVSYSLGQKTRTFSGTAQTEKITNLSFRNSGIITVFNIQLGQEIKKGELLARLDNVEVRLSYQQAITTLNSAESQMNTAKLALEREKVLYEKGSSSLSDFEAAKDSYKTAKASYNSAVKGVDIQAEQIQYGYITAPEDGKIASVSAEINENIQAGEIVGVLNSGTDMEISLGIPESVINGLRMNMEVEIEFPALQDQIFKGVVSEISPAVDNETATYPVTVVIKNPTDDIKSGMASNVTFDLKNENFTEVLVIPAYGLGEDSKGNFVFLIETNNGISTVKRQSITVGALSTDGFEILSGLSEGQKIAVAGLQTLLN
ncbi:MAG: efflux RND transporter periplasmic adaptor subunit, partial [Bacteroidota bacterium]